MANRSGKISLEFGNDTHVFKLGYGQLKELQDAVDAGPYYILESLFKNTWRVEFVRETIRCGLIGGGMSGPEAIRMVRTYVEDVESYPLQTNVLIAADILNAALLGAPEEDDEKNRSGGGQNLSPLEKGKIRFAPIYAAGAVIGFTPAQIDEMSIWEFDAVVEGYIEANTPDDVKNNKLTPEEEAAITADILALG